MMRVKAVSGPVRATVGQSATYRATDFSVPHPTVSELQKINWVVRCDNVDIYSAKAHGPTLDFAVPAALLGKTIRVMPYRTSPSANVSVVTSVQPRDHDEALGLGQATSSAKLVTLTNEGSRWYASINNAERFYVGDDVRYQDRRGLMNTRDNDSACYAPTDYEQQHGFWAHFIVPTALCESGGFFNRINTYDRAAFTFGFLQYAAHTPNDNFVSLFRALLALPDAAAYFPDLTIINGRIARESDHGTTLLESDANTQPLMDYLNREGARTDNAEIINAAKMIDWCRSSRAHRDMQVDVVVRDLRRKVASYSKRYGLDGVVDTVCLIIADIRHQGRANSQQIIDALQSDNAVSALLRIGETQFPERIATLRNAVDDLIERNVLMTHKYDNSKKDFVAL